MRSTRLIRTNRMLLLAGTMLLAGTAIPAFAQDASAEKPADHSEAGLADIVVSAQRQEDRLQNVPVTVSAFSGAELETRQIHSLVDIVKDVPNLIGHNNVGLSTATTVFLRGVGSTQSFATVDTTVGFYVDDVYIARQNANNFSMFDVERVEVLRGPQGTLYGRNTSGGAIKLVLKRPSQDFSASVEGSIGNYETFGMKGSVNVPLSDTVAIRLNAASQQQNKGYAYNVTTGKRDNDRSIEGYRAALRWTPNSSIDWTLSADYTSEDSNGIVPVDIRGAARPKTKSLFLTSSGSHTYNDTVSWGIASHLNVSAAFAEISSITSYRRMTQDYALDLSDQPVPIYMIDNDGDHRQFSQEIQLTRNTDLDGRLALIGGVFYMKEWNETLLGDINNPQLADGTRVPGGRLVKSVDNDTRSFALFGQATLEVIDNLKVTAGLRYTDDQKDVSVVQRNAAGTVTYDTSTLVGLGIPVDMTFKKWTPKFGIDWRISPDVMVYGSYTKGFKSGGWNSRVTNPRQFYTIQPEGVRAWEVGVKSEWFDHKLRVNAAGFITSVDDLVIGTIGTTQAFETLNSDVKIKGLELEVTAAPLRGLEFFGNLGLLDADYVKLGSDPLNFRGRPLPRVSDVTLKVGGSYGADTSFGRISVNADYSYTSPYYASASAAPITRVGKVELVNAAVTAEFDEGKYTASVGCRNCLNREYFHSVLDFPVFAGGRGFSAAYAGDPRTVLATFRAKF